VEGEKGVFGIFLKKKVDGGSGEGVGKF